MFYSRLLLLLLITLMLFSCGERTRQDNRQARETLSDWRYFGESEPGKTAVVFSPTIISTEQNERDFAMSPSGTEIFYSFVLPSNNLSSIIYLSHDGAFWSGKQTAPFSGGYSDLEPAFSPDGNRLFFASKRPESSGDQKNDWNIWYADKTGDGWSEARLLQGPVNTEGDEFYPSVSQSGNLYFTASREEGHGSEDIYMAPMVNGSYGDPVNLGTGVNTASYEFNAFVAPDESYLIFSSYGREDGLGGGDLYISFRENDTTWTQAKNLGRQINSDKLDYCPFVSHDNKYLFFTSQRIDPKISDKKNKSYTDLMALTGGIENGLGNIYWAAFDPMEWK